MGEIIIGYDTQQAILFRQDEQGTKRLPLYPGEEPTDDRYMDVTHDAGGPMVVDANISGVPKQYIRAEGEGAGVCGQFIIHVKTVAPVSG